jgi:hypothetical protein
MTTCVCELRPLTDPHSTPQKVHEWLCSSIGVILTGKSQECRRETYPSATFSAINHKWCALEVNPGLRGKIQWRSHLSYGMISILHTGITASNWTRSQATSVVPHSSQPISLRCILMLSFYSGYVSQWEVWKQYFTKCLHAYSPQITSWTPQGMRVLRQCKVPRAEVMFVTIQRENIRPSKKEMNKAVTTQTKLHCVWSWLWSRRLLTADQ